MKYMDCACKALIITANEFQFRIFLRTHATYSGWGKKRKREKNCAQLILARTFRDHAISETNQILLPRFQKRLEAKACNGSWKWYHDDDSLCPWNISHMIECLWVYLNLKHGHADFIPVVMKWISSYNHTRTSTNSYDLLSFLSV